LAIGVLACFLAASAPSASEAATATAGPDVVAAQSRAESAVSDPGGNTNGARGLAIPGYDALSASQVVERLVGLEADELVAVRDYERAHRQRRTILGKIEQLAAG